MTIPHDPAARLDYSWPWGPWLPEGDAITAATVISDDPAVTVADVTHDGDTVTAWASGGSPGTLVALTCHITTTGGRQDDRTIHLSIQER